MNFMLHHCHPVYMCVYNLLSCIFDSYSSNLGKMQIQMVSIGATKNHIARCNKNGNWKARPDRDVGLSEFLAFCSVKNCHTFFFLIQNDKYLSWIPLHEHFCELYSTCWESWKESSPFNGGEHPPKASQHPGNSMHESAPLLNSRHSDILTGQGLSEIADLGAEACMTWMINFFHNQR